MLWKVSGSKLHDQRYAREGKVTLGVRTLFPRFCRLLGTRGFPLWWLSVLGPLCLLCPCLSNCIPQTHHNVVNLYSTTKHMNCFFFVLQTLVYSQRLCGYTGWGKSRFIFVCIENNTIINNIRINQNYVLHNHNRKPTFAPICIPVNLGIFLYNKFLETKMLF